MSKLGQYTYIAIATTLSVPDDRNVCSSSSQERWVQNRSTSAARIATLDKHIPYVRKMCTRGIERNCKLGTDTLTIEQHEMKTKITVQFEISIYCKNLLYQIALTHTHVRMQTHMCTHTHKHTHTHTFSRA